MITATNRWCWFTTLFEARVTCKDTVKCLSGSLLVVLGCSLLWFRGMLCLLDLHIENWLLLGPSSVCLAS